MSEPVSNAEIEDVLSSIRRLVSENTGPLKREAAPEQGGEKLVLTPAFRVDEGESDEVDAVSADDEGTEPVVALNAETWSDDTPDDEAPAPDAGENTDVSAESDAPELTGDVAPPAEAIPAGREPAADPAPVREPASELEKRIAELEAVVSLSSAEFEPDGSEVDELPDAIVFHHANPAVAVQADGETGAPTGTAGPVSEQAESASEAHAPGSRGPTLVLHRTDPDVSDDSADDAEAEAEGEPEHDSVTEWEDVVPSAPTALDAVADDDHDPYGFAEDDTDIEPIAADDPDEVGDDDDETTLLDEDALGEMVARMVRDELQGSIGERITHNVRRMVRREIARALALKDFE